MDIKLDRQTLPKDGQYIRFKTEDESWHDGYFVDGDDIFSVSDKVFFFSWNVHEWEPLDNTPPRTPSGANVLVEAIYKIQKELNKRSGLTVHPQVNNWVNDVIDETMAQYNAVEPDRTQSHLEKMCIRAQELFTEKKDNPKNKKHGLQDAWNNLANALYDANQFLNKKVVKSQSPQTPIDREPEGKKPLFYIKHLGEGWTGAVLESEKMEDWRLGWLRYDVIDNPNETDILGGSIAAAEIFQSGKYDYSSSFPIITRK